MSAKSPSEYCNDIVPPALKLAIDEYENALYDLSDYQGTHYPIDDPHASSSVGSNSMRGIDLNQSPTVKDEGIDLNQLPSDEHEGIDLNQFPAFEDIGINLNQFPRVED